MDELRNYFEAFKTFFDNILKSVTSKISNTYGDIKTVNIRENELQPIMYDIYYSLLALSKNNTIERVLVNSFKYSDNFELNILDTDYVIEVTAMKDSDDTYSIHNRVLFNNVPIKWINMFGYDNYYKKHDTYNSLINEINNITLFCF